MIQGVIRDLDVEVIFTARDAGDFLAAPAVPVGS
jgi:hypothetical protein